MKRSKYCHLVGANGGYYLFSNISGSVVEVDDERIRNLLVKNLYFISKESITEEGMTDEEFDFLCENGFYINDTDDEDSLFAARIDEYKARKELNVLFALTLDCNFRCVYCFENHDNVFMSQKEIVDTITHIENRCTHEEIEYLRIAYYGGEPLLQYDNLLFAHNLIERKFSNIKHDYLLITNGFELTTDKIAQLKKSRSNFSVQITIDGPQAVHDARRPLLGGTGTYHRIIENLVNCARFLQTVIRLNIDKLSYPYLVDFFQQLKEIGINSDNITLSPNFVSANTCTNRSYQNAVFSPVEMLEVVKKTSDIIARYGFKCDIQNDNGKDFPFPLPSFIYCPAYSGKHLVFCPGGDIYACLERVGREESLVGNIYNNPVYNAHNQEWERFTMASCKRCKECNVSSFCGGGCGSRAINETGKLQPTCGMLKEKSKKYSYLF